MLREEYSTHGLPVRQKIEHWDGLLKREFGSDRSSWSSQGQFDGAISILRSDCISMISTRSDDFEFISRGGENGAYLHEDCFHLVLQCEGRSWREDALGSFTLHPGQFALVSHQSHYRVQTRDGSRALIVRLPRTRMHELAHRVEPLVGTAMAGTSGRGALLYNFIQLAWSNLEDDLDIECDEYLNATVHSLVQMAYPLPQHSSKKSRYGSLHSEAVAFIRKNFQDPDMNSRIVAGNLGISLRYLERLFADMGQTPSATILTERLDWAARQLQGEYKPALVTQIAYEAGFSDLSYFHRSFKRRFAVTPLRYHRRAFGL